MPSPREKYEQNLNILAKLKNGDMLAAAGSDGLFKRKTNVLTQVARDQKTHDPKLIDQIGEVLVAGTASSAHELTAALRGLATLASTYQSKGAKEHENFTKLSDLLNQYRSVDTSEATTLKQLCSNALRFLNNCRIRSVNNNWKGGWGNSYFTKELDWLLFYAFVRSEAKAPGNTLKQDVLKIMRSNVSRSTKRQRLAEAFKRNGLTKSTSRRRGIGRYDLNAFVEGAWNRNPKGKYFWNPGDRKDADRERIELARNAITMRFGNCLDKSCIIATQLAEATASTMAKPGIALVEGVEYNHAWVFVSNDRAKLESAFKGKGSSSKPQPKKGFIGKVLRVNQFADYPEDTLVVDGWTRDLWSLRDYFNSPANPRQVGVRSKIRSAVTDGKVSLREMVKWPPPMVPGQPEFRLAFAHIPWECGAVSESDAFYMLANGTD